MGVDGGQRPNGDCRAGRYTLSRAASLTAEDRSRYGSTGRWFNFGTRRFVPSLYYEVDSEVQRIIGALMTLNRTGLYSASFSYRSMIGTLDIQIFAGVEQLLSKPVYEVEIDCRYDLLCDHATGEPFSADGFIEWLTLLVQ